jgi:hypothetical protein
MRHRLVITAALLLALAGCSDDSPAPKASASTTPTTAAPSATGLTAPVLPEAAKENTAVGAKAFVRYWFEATTYAMKTGDTGPLAEASSPECATCTNLVTGLEKIYSAGNRNVGGGWIVDEIAPDPRQEKPARRFQVVVNQPAQHLVDSDGTVTDRDPKARYVFALTARWSDGWRIDEVVKLA